MRRALPPLVRTLGPTDDRVIVLMWDEAITAEYANLPDEADRLWSEGIQHFEKHLSPDHPAVAQFLKGKAFHRLERTQWQEAMNLLQRALPIYQRTFGTNHNHTLDAEDLVARAYEQKGETKVDAMQSPIRMPSHFENNTRSFPGVHSGIRYFQTTVPFRTREVVAFR